MLVRPVEKNFAGLSRSEKKKVIRKCLIQSWPEPDRKIARAHEVSPTTIGNHRKELEKEGLIPPQIQTGHSSEACPYEVSSLAIRRAPVNDDIYKPIHRDDKGIQELAQSIKKYGLDNRVVVSRDGVIVSGHRRYFAMTEILEWDRIPIEIRPDICYRDDPEEFLKTIVRFNDHQREKTVSESVREGIVKTSAEPWQAVCDYREESAELTAGLETVELQTGQTRSRSRIVQKMSLRQAILDVVEASGDEPLSARRIFYLLLNIPGLLQNDVTRKPFENTPKCYNNVTNMVTRMRVFNVIPFDRITYETRATTQAHVFSSVSEFIDQDLENLFSGYWRDLLQGQPNQVELLVEKNTVAATLRSVALKYRMPMTSGRGYSSLPPRYQMFKRLENSGRENLVVIAVTDHDPEGMDIPRAFADSIIEDFGLAPERIMVVPAALRSSQIQSLNLHEGQLAKRDSSRYKAYAEKYGERVWELEAVPPERLREIVEETIQEALDIDLFDEELKTEREEQEQLRKEKQKILHQPGS